jgi:hypothetical protein
MSEQKTQRVDPAFELRPPRETHGGLPTVIEHGPQLRRRWRLRVKVMAFDIARQRCGGHRLVMVADIDTKFAGPRSIRLSIRSVTIPKRAC